MEVSPFDVELAPKRLAVFQMILNAGKDGVSEDELDAKLFNGKGKSTVRSAIHYINKQISPLKIDSRKGFGYRIVRDAH